MWLSLLGEANTKNRCTSSSSKELKSIPSLLTPKATVSFLALSVLAWGIATPLPIPVLPNFSLSTKALRISFSSPIILSDFYNNFDNSTKI